MTKAEVSGKSSGGVAKSPALKTRGSSGADAYDALFEAMISGRLKPGDRLREAEIAKMLGVSRTPVREAMRRLEVEGLLVHQPRKGVIIRELDHSAVTELYLVRVTLEGMAAREAARHASEVEIEALQDMVAAEAAMNVDAVKRSRANKVFHQTIYRAAHNRYLLDMLGRLDVTMSILGQTTLSLPERLKTALVEHGRIVDAIAARDPAAAQEAAEEHIRGAHRARLNLLFQTETAERHRSAG